MRIYRKLRWLDDPALFRPWAYRIASREAFRFVAAQQQSQTRYEQDSRVEAMPDTPAALSDAGEVDRLVAPASPASRAVLILHYQHVR